MTVSKFVNAFGEIFVLNALGKYPVDGDLSTDVAGCINGFKDNIKDIDYQFYYTTDALNNYPDYGHCLVTVKFGRSYVQCRVYFDLATYKVKPDHYFMEVVVHNTKKQRTHVYKPTKNTIAYFYDLAINEYKRNEKNIKKFVKACLKKDRHSYINNYSEGNIHVEVQDDIADIVVPDETRAF